MIIHDTTFASDFSSEGLMVGPRVFKYEGEREGVDLLRTSTHPVSDREKSYACLST